MTDVGDPASSPGERPESRRLKLAGVKRDRGGEFTCRARVLLEEPGGRRFEGLAELPLNDQNLLRVASQATVAALGEFLPPQVRLRLLGLRAMRIFDIQVVAVHLAARDGEAERLLMGLAPAYDDSALGAARAVLHATNRLFGNFIER